MLQRREGRGTVVRLAVGGLAGHPTENHILKQFIIRGKIMLFQNLFINVCNFTQINATRPHSTTGWSIFPCQSVHIVGE